MTDRYSATPMLVYPEPPIGITTLDSVIHWGEPAWTELFASCPAELYLAGLSWDTIPTAAKSSEIEFGIGPEGQVDIIHTYRVEFRYSANSTRTDLWFEVPLGNIPQGSRLCMRAWGWNNNNSGSRWNLMYYENFVSGHKTAARAKCFPFRGDSLNIGGIPAAWGTTPWQESAWYEITPGEDEEITITSIHYQPSNMHNCAAQIDLARGAVGTEHANILTTKRFWHTPNNNPICRLVLPGGGYPVPAGTRVSFRIRRANANLGATASSFSFNYIYNTSFLD